MTHDLPPGWALASIGAVSTVNPSSTTVSAPDDQQVTFLPMAAVEELSGKIDLGTRRPFRDVKKGFTRFRNGDVLFAKITPSMENGKVAVAADLEGGIGCGTTEFHVLRPKSGVLADYIRYFMVRSAYRQEARRNMQGAVGQQRVPADFVRDSQLPLAPENEQKRIVSKIDELFSRIDEGERALEQVSKLVERYHQSVLKAAVTGELTRNWREAREAAGEPVESGEALLTRILIARREAWEQAELAKMKAKGAKPANDNWKKKYDEPVPLDTCDLPKLPDGWAWTSLGQIKTFSLYGPRFSSDDYVEDGYLVLRTSDISKAGRVNVAAAPRLRLTPEEFRKYRVEKSDLLVTRTGSLGTLALFNDDVEAIPGAYLIQFRVPAPDVTRWYLFHFLKSPIGQEKLLKGGAGVGRPNLNAPSIESIPIPLPPLAEQIAIVDLIESTIESLGKMLEQVKQSAMESSALRQSALRAAFSGQLAKQDPSDEPASVLIQRIAADRTKSMAAATKRGHKKKSA
jgi:type I restriction enzyme S subunit